VKEIVAYAGEHGIRVYPGSTSGHTTSWFVSHPELASMPGPYAIEREWGIMDAALDPSKEEVYRFLDGFLGEMAALFPDAYLHIGGDEVNGKHWDASERLVAFKKEKGFKTAATCWAASASGCRIMTRHGKRMIGWDEILLPSLPKDSVVHSWRGQGRWGPPRSRAGGILSNGYYIDLM
jgi:hexosaminidase